MKLTLIKSPKPYMESFLGLGICFLFFAIGSGIAGEFGRADLDLLSNGFLFVSIIFFLLAGLMKFLNIQSDKNET